MNERIFDARETLRDRVPLNAQAVTYSAQDALDTLIRFEVAVSHYNSEEHTDHDAPCLKCFWEVEVEAFCWTAEAAR